MEELSGRGKTVSIVIDASATLASIYPDETTAAITAVFNRVIAEDAWVPGLWRIEIANSLAWSVRRGRMSLARRDEALVDLARLPIFDDTETAAHVWGRTLLLADVHRLTVYDAIYLELALRLSLPLATLDEDLRRAAQQERIPLLGK
jgi:predicted nucleic acid-binding protein